MPLQHSPAKGNRQDAAGEQQENRPEATPPNDSPSFHGFADWEVAMDAVTLKELQGLYRQRTQAKKKVVRVQRTLITNESLGLAQLTVLSKSLSATYAEYSGIHNKVLALVPDEAIEDQEEEYASFEDVYYTVSNAVEELLLEAKNNAAPPAAQSVTPTVVIQQQPLRAPIPTFDGNYSGWPKFKAVFQDLMAHSADTDAIKLYHLDKALIGGAAGVLDTKVLSEGNYQQAWNILEERYENKRLLVETHIHGLFSLREMSSESHKELRALLTEATHHVESLKFLEQQITGVSEHMIVYQIVSALDKSTRKSWEGTQKKGELPKYNSTIAFLTSRCQILENCEAAFPPMPSKLKQALPPSKIQPQKSHAAATNPSQPTSVCEICGGSHRNVQCSTLSNLTPAQRIEKIRAAGICFNCLRKGHRSNLCPSDKACLKCQRRHHTLLHDDGASSQENVSLPAEAMATQPPVPVAPSQPSTSVQKIPAPVESSVSTTCSCYFVRPTKTVLLLTAVVHALDVKNQPYSCRVMLDSGSQVNFVTEEMANRLGLQKHQANVPITGINAMQTHARDMVKMKIRSRTSSYHANLECLVTPQVTGAIPASKIDTTNWDVPDGFLLADPEFHTPANVDLLIGGELFFAILKTSRLDLGDGLPELRDTHLGWIVSGVVREAITPNWLPQHSNLALVPNIEPKAIQHGQTVEKINCPKRTVKLPATTNSNQDLDPVVDTCVIPSQPKLFQDIEANKPISVAVDQMLHLVLPRSGTKTVSNSSPISAGIHPVLQHVPMSTETRPVAKPVTMPVGTRPMVKPILMVTGIRPVVKPLPMSVGIRPMAKPFPMSTGTRPVAKPIMMPVGTRPMVMPVGTHLMVKPILMVTGIRPVVKPFPMSVGIRPMAKPFPMSTGTRPVIKPSMMSVGIRPMVRAFPMSVEIRPMVRAFPKFVGIRPMARPFQMSVGIRPIVKLFLTSTGTNPFSSCIPMSAGNHPMMKPFSMSTGNCSVVKPYLLFAGSHPVVEPSLMFAGIRPEAKSSMMLAGNRPEPKPLLMSAGSHLMTEPFRKSTGILPVIKPGTMPTGICPVFMGNPKQLAMPNRMNTEVASPLDSTNASTIMKSLDLSEYPDQYRVLQIPVAIRSRRQQSSKADPAELLPGRLAVLAADVSIKPSQFLFRFLVQERSNNPRSNLSEWVTRFNLSARGLHWPTESPPNRDAFVPWPDEIQRVVDQYPRKRLANVHPIGTNGLGNAGYQFGHSPLRYRRCHPILSSRQPAPPWLLHQDSADVLQVKHTDQLQGILPVPSEVPSPLYIEASVPYFVPFKIKDSRPPWRRRLRPKVDIFEDGFRYRRTIHEFRLQASQKIFHGTVLSILNRGEYVPSPDGSEYATAAENKPLMTAAANKYHRPAEAPCFAHHLDDDRPT